MDDNERKKKLQAGREKFAEFLRKKNSPEKSKRKSLCDNSDIGQTSVVTGASIGENDSVLDKNENIPLVTDMDDHKRSDHKIVIEEYKRRIQEFQAALCHRDDIITQLSDRLIATIQNRDRIQTEAGMQAENLAKEISMLKLQLQQAREILGRQKDKDGISLEFLEGQKQVISLLQELDEVKEHASEVQEQNTLLAKEIEEWKIIAKNEDYVEKINILQKEKDELSEEVNHLNSVKDEISLINEKIKLLENLNKQLQKDNSCLQEENVQMKELLNSSLKKSKDISIALESANNRIQELLQKQDEYDKLTFKNNKLNTEIKQLTSDLNKSHTEIKNKQQQLDNSHLQLEDAKKHCLSLKEELLNVHKDIEKIKKEMEEKHETELLEKEILLKNEFSSYKEKLISEEKQKNLKEIKELQFYYETQITKQKEEFNYLLTEKQQLENTVKEIKVLENITSSNKIDTECNTVITYNNECYDDESSSTFLPEVHSDITKDKSIATEIEEVQKNNININMDDNPLLQNTSYLSLEYLKEFIDDKIFEKYVDDAILRLTDEKKEIENRFINQINNLELANCDLQAQIDELKVQYDHIKSCKINLEDELSQKNSDDLVNVDTCEMNSVFNNSIELGMHKPKISVLQNKLHLEFSVKESLHRQIIFLRKKCELYESYKEEMKSYILEMQEQLKYSWSQYDKVVKDIFDMSITSNKRNEEISFVKKENPVHIEEGSNNQNVFVAKESEFSSKLITDHLEIEIESLRSELKEMQEIFLKENTFLRSALHHEQTMPKLCTSNAQNLNLESEEILNIHQKFLLLLDCNHELLEEKRLLQIQLMQQEQLLIKMQETFYSEGNDKQEILHQLNKLQEQNRNLISELREHTGVHSNISQLLSNDVFQEYLQIQKKLLLEKIQDKELLEIEITRLRKEFECQAKELNILEQHLSHRDILEQTFYKKKRILEEELSEIYQKLQEQKENLAKEGIRLQTELRQKDLIFKQKQLDMNQKQIEFQGQTAMLKADHEASFSNFHVKVSKETLNYISKLHNELDIIHKQATQLLKSNLEKEYAEKELKMAEMYRTKIKELKMYYMQQIATFYAQLEIKLASNKDTYDLVTDETIPNFCHHENEHYSEFTSFRNDLDACNRVTFDNIFDHWNELHKEEIEQIKQSFKEKMEAGLLKQKDELLQNVNISLKDLDAKLSEENINVLVEHHDILSTENNNEVVAIVEKYNKEIEKLKNQQREALEGTTVIEQKSFMDQIEILKHKLAEEHHRYVQYLSNKWLETNSERLQNLKVKIKELFDRGFEIEEDQNSIDTIDTVDKIRDLLLEKEEMLMQIQEIKCCVKTNMDEIGLLQEHIHANYDILLEIYQNILNDNENKSEMFSFLQDESFCQELSNEEHNVTKETNNVTEGESDNELKDNEFTNLVSDLIPPKLLLDCNKDSNMEQYYQKQYETDIKLNKLHLDNIVKRLLLKNQIEKDELKKMHKNHLSEIFLQLDETKKLINDFEKENYPQDIANANEYLSFSCGDGMNVFQQQTQVEKPTEKHEFEKKNIDLIKNTEDDWTQFQELKNELVSVNTKLQSFKNKVCPKKHMNTIDIIQIRQKELEQMYQKILIECAEGDKSVKNEMSNQMKQLKKNLDNVNELCKNVQEKFCDEAIVGSPQNDIQILNETLELEIKQLNDEKHSILVNKDIEIDHIKRFYKGKLENILNTVFKKLKEEFYSNDQMKLNNAFEDMSYLEKMSVDEICEYTITEICNSLENIKCNLELQLCAFTDLQNELQKKTIQLEELERMNSVRLQMITCSTETEPEKQIFEPSVDKCIITDETCHDINLKFELMEDMEQLQSQMEKDMALYNQENGRLFEELLQLKSQYRELEKIKKALEIKLENIQTDNGNTQAMKLQDLKQKKDWQTDTELATVDLRSWQVQAAQTNSRLLHVLSDLVKTFFDIEQDINNRLIQLGLDVINSTDNTFQPEEEVSLITVGSREDFSVFMGETMNLELSEDGPDLTPRSWDCFTSSIVGHEVEMEGEDVVLGASRRLRAAVERVLRLLSHAVEVQQNQDLRSLLRRNEELLQDLQEEMKNKDMFQIELMRVESAWRKSEQERHKLEDAVHGLKEAKDTLNKELTSTCQRLQHLEEVKEILTEEKRYVGEQCRILSSNMGQKEQPEDEQASVCTDTICPEEVLLQENSKLSSEKHKLQQNYDKEKQHLLSRIHHLELMLEESVSQKDDVIEEKCREIEDLKSQMDSIEKQLMSYKRFIEEQAQERELERDEYLKEVAKLQDIVKEKERIQNNDERLTKEVEILEQQLKVKMEDHREMLKKRDQVEADLRQSVDKIHDLRDVISELEQQLDMKSHLEIDLKQKIMNLEMTISEQEKENHEMTNELEQLRASSNNRELNNHIRQLEEQLESRGQQLEQLKNYHTLFHEFHGHIHSLEVKIDSKLHYFEIQKLSQFHSSPVPSEDTSLSESQDGELHQTSDIHLALVEEIQTQSPSSVNWNQMKRFEDKIDALLKAAEELLKQNKNMELQMKILEESKQEILCEKTTLQEQLSNQLLQISALKEQIEEQRHNLPILSNSMKSKVCELQKNFFEEQQEELLESRLQELTNEISRLQKQLEEKDELLKPENPCNKTESEILIQELSSLKEENSELKHEVEKLRSTSENSSLPDFAKLLLDDKNEEIDFLNQQVHNLQGLVETLQKKEQEAELTEEVYKENAEHVKDIAIQVGEDLTLTSKLSNQNENINHQHCVGVQTAFPEPTTTQMNPQREVNILLKELDCLHKHYEKLQDDFDNMKVVLNKKEKVVIQLQEENNQLRVQQNDAVESTNEVYGHQNTIAEDSYEKNNSKYSDFNTFQNHAFSIKVTKDTENGLGIDQQNGNMKSQDKKVETEKTENLIYKFHQDEIEYVKKCLEKSFQDEKKVITDLYNERVRCIQQNMEKRYEDKRLELVKHFEEVLQVAKENFIKKLDAEKEKLKNEYEENLNLIRCKFEKQIQSERVNLQECHKDNMKVFEKKLQKNWEEEKRKIYLLHQEEIEEMNKDTQKKISFLQHTLNETYRAKVEQLESKYVHEIVTLRTMLKRAKVKSEIVASGNLNLREDSSCADSDNLQYTSSIEDEVKGILPNNVEKLLNKVYKEGLQVLSLTERQLLKNHLAPSSENRLSFTSIEDRQMLLNELHLLRELIKRNAEACSWRNRVEHMDWTDKKEQEKLMIEPDGKSQSVSDINNRILEIGSSRQNSDIRQIIKELIEELQNARRTFSNQQIVHLEERKDFEQKVHKLEQQKEQIESQLATQRDLLEFRTTQEKALIDDLQKSLDAEKIHNTDLISQLNNFRKKYMELEITHSTCEAEILCLRQALEGQKQHMSSCLSALEMEKSYSQCLLKALESERSSFAHMKMALELEQQNEKTVGACDQQFLKKNCPECAKFESILMKERKFWTEHQETLNKLLADANNEIHRLKETLPITNKTNNTIEMDSKLHHLYWRFRRSESYRHALIFQKNYLLMLLGGFQHTEKTTLSVLRHLTVCNNQKMINNSLDFNNSKSDIQGCCRFRSVVYCVVAVNRMKYLVSKWQRAAEVPSSHTVKQEFKSLKPKFNRNGSISKSNRLLTTSELPEHSFPSGNIPSILKQAMQENPEKTGNVTTERLVINSLSTSDTDVDEVTNNKRNLGEYITRLEFLHQLLGLETTDK